MSTWAFSGPDNGGFHINIDGGPLFWREGATIDEVMHREGISDFTITQRDDMWDVRVYDLDAQMTLEELGLKWNAAREHERELAAQVYEAIRQASAVGFNEVQIAKMAGCDRMTVRRALGKL